MLTLNALFPVGHKGIIALKFMVDRDGGLTGQAWTLWSNSRLVSEAINVFNGVTIQGSTHQLRVARSRDAFKFTASGPDVSKARYAFQRWDP